LKRLCPVVLLALFVASGLAQAQQSTPLPRQQSKKATIAGVLVFVGEKPAIKTESATVILSMPRFYEYAYAEDYKAGIAIQAKGELRTAPDKSSQATLIADEVAIGSKIYVIVAGGQEKGPGGRGGTLPPDAGAGRQ
jgi:hypothetical protein